MPFNFRNNGLLILSAIVFLASAALVSIYIDTERYEPRKRNLIVEEYFVERPVYGLEFKQAVEDFVLRIYGRRPSEEVRRGEERIRDLVESRIFSGDSPIVAFELIRNEQSLVEMERENYVPSRSPADNLLPRPFRATVKQPFRMLGEKPVTAQAVFTYATPHDLEPLRDLTTRYRFYLGGILLAMTAAYVLALRYILLPIKKVVEAIQNSRDRVATFIASPATRLEKLYNRLARSALLTSLGAELDDAGLRMTPGEMTARLAPRVREWFGFDEVFLIGLSRETLKARRSAPHVAPDALDRMRGLLVKAAGEALREPEPPEGPRFFAHMTAAGDAWFFGLLPGEPQADTLSALVLVKRDVGVSSLRNWHQPTAERVHRRIADLAARRILQSRELFREKSEANINLSRNLGHDLTNIIATGRLELMTVGQLLKRGAGEWLQRPETVEIVQESLSRLLDNTRGLQEIVNLYRAYEYLRSPRYEETDLNVLLDEVIEIFELSMSAHAQVAFKRGGDLLKIKAEPRLLKLAAFNLLVNAQDAIRRLPPERQGEGEISVQTLWDRDRGRAVVRVRDNGPGIRTPEGDLAGEEEVLRIFDLGYSTKSGGKGEGLGLSWVRTILTEFHRGALQASNPPGGGALFEISLPLGGGEAPERRTKGTETAS